MNNVLEFSGWRYRAVVWSVALSALLYLGFSLWSGWQSVSDAVLRVGLGGIALALLLSLINYGLRFLRWQAYLRALETPVPWKPSLRIYLAGFALTTTPGKAGEALRGVLLKPWGVPYSRSFAAFFSERLSDLFAVVLLTLLGLTLYPATRPIIIAGIVLVALVFFALSRRALLERLAANMAARKGKAAAALGHVLSVLLEAQRCHRPGMLVTATTLSLLAWSAEALGFYGVLHWMGAQMPLSFVVFVYAVSMLAGALSLMPGGLGGAEAVMVGLLIWKGLPGADAVAATVLIRLATLWFAVALGVWALLREKRRAVRIE